MTPTEAAWSFLAAAISQEREKVGSAVGSRSSSQPQLSTAPLLWFSNVAMMVIRPSDLPASPSTHLPTVIAN